MICVGHIARTVEARSINWKTCRRTRHERPSYKWEDNTKVCHKDMRCVWTGFIWLRIASSDISWGGWVPTQLDPSERASLHHWAAGTFPFASHIRWRNFSAWVIKSRVVVDCFPWTCQHLRHLQFRLADKTTSLFKTSADQSNTSWRSSLKLSSVFISLLCPAEVAIFSHYSLLNSTTRLHILRLYVLCPMIN
jgi:hypothetical protein